MSLIGNVKGFFAARKFLRSGVGATLNDYTKRYFYSEGEALYWFDDNNKRNIVQDMYEKVFAVSGHPNGRLALREALVEYVLGYTSLLPLSLKEHEKAAMWFAESPYVSGELYHHIDQAVPHNEELERFQFEQANGDPLAPDDYIDFCNSRSTVYLFYMNCMNVVRIDSGDVAERDWFKPLVEACLINQEDYYREKMGQPSLLPNRMDGLAYGTFWNYVLSGETNPLFKFKKEWPRLSLTDLEPSTN